ncbi:uncharacterized protein LOC132200441 [Neocloeon triangulifer]|uniref:uncharacterized protein LOC132200441 n=1 Tax=Neocloeon triangulifer TaxID=2078957 RepID=UPI00286F5EB8|nr:uncharacterized protein LOC132200441 [Neocloeon triangulifer]
MENPRAPVLRAERRLIYVYALGACFSIIGLICTAVSFGYWHFTLDECEGHPNSDQRHCGCLLFTESSTRLLIGGDTRICHFVEFSCIPGIAVGIIMAVWHWYRVAFVLNKAPKPKRYRRRPVNAQDDIPGFAETVHRVEVVQKPSVVRIVTWLTVFFVVMVVGALSLASAVTITIGTVQSCQQYRENLIETLSADGYMAALIKDRLSCQAVFDFMDYLLPIKERYSANFINTGVALQMAIVAIWFSAVTFIMGAVICFIEALRGSRICCSRR